MHKGRWGAPSPCSVLVAELLEQHFVILIPTYADDGGARFATVRGQDVVIGMAWK